MCGIAAIVGEQHLSGVKQMIEKISHRGPDGQGFAFLEGASFGHVRLAILDLTETSAQPMHSPCGRYLLVFNGEIYNYLELQQHLGETAGDSEILLKALIRWGKGALPKLNGMFSFLFYDKEKRELFGARDRFGEKPLYYWRSPRGFYAFGSEIKQFTSLPGWKAKLSGQEGYAYLNWGLTDHGRSTLFQDVFQIRGGECFTLSNGKLQTERWYQLQGETPPKTLQEAGEKFHSLLQDSIRLRLRSDVPIGTCLSGGLDSSSIVCLLSDLGRKPKTFSACFSQKHLCEKEYMEAVQEKTGVIAHYLYPQEEILLEDLKKIVWHQDEPFGSTSIFAQWEVFKQAAAAGVKVMLDGQGADEQLGGYRCSHLHSLQEYLSRGKLVSFAKGAMSAPLLPLLGIFVPKPMKDPLKKLLGKNTKEADWLDLDKLQASPYDPFRGKNFKEHRALQLLETSLPMLLRYEDRDSMAHSLEARTPFLDHRLVEFSLGLPAEFLVRDGVTKTVLREGLRTSLPPKIYKRRTKLGFETPESEWMQHPHFRELLEKAIERSGGVINRNIFLSRPHFRAICFSLWMEAFDVSL